MRDNKNTNTSKAAQGEDINRPGKLISDDYCEIETEMAVRLFHSGRRNARGVGVYHFAKLIRTPYQASYLDNPYADWFLLKLERYCFKTLQYLQALIEEEESWLNKTNDFQFTVSHSKNPVKMRLSFSVNGYGFLAARLAKRYDNLVKIVMSARHKGLALSKTYEDLLYEPRKRVRRVLSFPLKWPKACVVTRHDIALNNDAAHLAAECMKKQIATLPDAVLSGEKRPRFAPCLWIKKEQTVDTTHTTKLAVQAPIE